jgi:hypothetical protein
MAACSKDTIFVLIGAFEKALIAFWEGGQTKALSKPIKCTRAHLRDALKDDSVTQEKFRKEKFIDKALPMKERVAGIVRAIEGGIKMKFDKMKKLESEATVEG